MAWVEISFAVTAEAAEALAEALEELGAQAVTLRAAGQEAIFDRVDESPTLWHETRLTALFDAEIDAIVLLAELRNLLGILPPHEIQPLADQDWNRVWMDRFQPIRFGARVWVVPSWHTPPDAQAVNIILDPGMAFGTGTHATTALCLRWLDQYAAALADGLAGKTVLDYGCGSGILAIAAAKLGAAAVYAVDIDPQCLAVTHENAARNEVSAQLQISLASHADQALPLAGVDVLLANILAEPLIQLAPHFAQLLKPRGHLVLSGLLAAQAPACLRAYAQHFDFAAAEKTVVVEDDWARLTGTRRA